MKEKREKKRFYIYGDYQGPRTEPYISRMKKRGGSNCYGFNVSKLFTLLAPLAPHLFEFIEEKYYFIFIDFPFLHTPLSVLIYCSTPFRPLKNNRIFPVQSDYTLFQPFGEL